ncbi:MAG: hypothetical protein Q8L54_00830 [Devosia sp.]|nr:hypothetical protein [Devosia sp.]
MIIVLEVALGLVVLGIVVSYLLRGRRAAERAAITGRRVEAYMQTIRREAANPELTAMSDAELKDLLLSSARNLRLQGERKWYLLVGGTVMAFLSAVMVGTQDGTRGFAVTLVIGAVVLYGLNQYLVRRMREPLVRRGLEVERLRVE